MVADTRRDYGEHRYQALGLIAERLHVLLLTPRSGKTHLLVFARPTNTRRYEAQAQS
jgi:uncharacterized DUF497 family protein